MNDLENKFGQLESKLESAAFMISRKVPAREAHAEIIRSLVILAELKSELLTGSLEDKKLSLSEVNEINKVSRRLKLWAKRQNQVNSKILNAFLKLERSGVLVITEDDLKKVSSLDEPFNTNFVQMKIIAEKNHGKVFQQYGQKVSLWGPVISQIREYERIVFDGE